MQILTWLAANGSTYQSSQPRAPEDIAIPDRPTSMPAGVYNRDAGVWERSYDTTPMDTDLTIGEAEQLYAWANAQKDVAGNNLGGVILTVLGV